MDLETLMGTVSAPPQPEPTPVDQNIFNIPKKAAEISGKEEGNSDGKDDQLDAVSHVTPFFAQQTNYETSLNATQAMTTAQMQRMATREEEDFTPLYEYLGTEKVGEMIPNDMVPLFLHYFHKKVKGMITHPRPTKYYLSSDPWGFKQFEHKKDIPKESSISFKKFFGQEIEPDEENLDIYRKRFIDRVLRKGPLKTKLIENGFVTKEKGGIMAIKAMGIEISEGEFLGIHDFITALDNPLPSEKKRKKAYSFGAGVSEVEKAEIFNEEIDEIADDLMYNSPEP
jgi:hypothetical protein